MFTGWAIGSLIVPQQADIRGRRKVLLTCLTFQIIFNSVIINVPKGPLGNEHRFYPIILALFFLQGFNITGITCIGYSYFQELVPSSHHNIMGTLWNVSEGLIYINLTLYYFLIDKHWLYPYLFGMTLNLVSLIAIMFLPESPKWLHC